MTYKDESREALRVLNDAGAIEVQPPMSRPHMGQIMAECEAAQRCLAETTGESR